MKQRLKIVRYTLATSVLAASRRFGLDRKTVRCWRDRYLAGGEPGLTPRYPRNRKRRTAQSLIDLMIEARKEHGYGPLRTKIWLQRVHKIAASDATIRRIMRDLGIPRAGRAVRRRRPRQLKLFEKERPGESVQVDVKVVRVGTLKCFQYTAIDDCTRMRVLRLFATLDQRSSLAFIAEIVRAFPFKIEKVQTDNGTEFSLAFVLRLRELGIKHRYIRPRRPQQNGKVERSHRTDSEEFWGRQSFRAFSEAVPGLAGWERHYNEERFSLALRGRTPAERLCDFLPAAA